MGYQNQTAIGTGVRQMPPAAPQPNSNGFAPNHQSQYVEQEATYQQAPAIQRRPTARSFSVQQIDSQNNASNDYAATQRIAADSYYDRPDIQTTSAQQFDDEIFIEEPAVRVAQTPAQLPGLRNSDIQAEPVSVLRTGPDNYSAPNYQEPAATEPEIAPFQEIQSNELRSQFSGTQDAEDVSVDEDDNGLQRKSFDKSCDQMRNELLNRSITDIALDISPIKNTNPTSYRPQHRAWTDQFGRQIATGIITSVSRGYVIVQDGGNVQRIPYGNLSDPDLEVVAQFWQVPKECTVSQDVFLGRSWAPQTLTWKASNLCHKPLYFENVQLERYGHSRGPFSQPIHSTVHFFSSLALLPYNTGINPPNECRYALGYYRPGDCAPWLEDPFPISLAGTRNQVRAMVGGAFLITP